MASSGPSLNALISDPATQALLESFAALKNHSLNQQEFNTKVQQTLAKASTPMQRAALRKEIVQLCLNWGRFAVTLADEITLEEVLLSVQEGPAKGLNVLYFLSIVAANGHSEPFLQVWKRFRNELKFEHLLVTWQEEPYKGIHALWLLSKASGESDIFTQIWEQFQGELKLEHLLLPAQEGPYKGKNALWFLANWAAEGKPEAFLKVWDKFQDELKPEHLLVSAREDLDKDKNVLLLLAVAVTNSNPEAFLMIWQKWKNKFRIDEHLLVPAQEGTCKGMNALWFLLPYNRGELLKDILQQAPGVIPESEFTAPVLPPKILTIFNQEKENFIPLIKARNEFFFTLNQLKQSNILSDDNVENLLTEAEKAQAAGYYNAFYDAGEYLFAQGRISEAFKAYESVPAQSCHFSRVNKKMVEQHFAASQESLAANEKQYYLRKALRAALQETNENGRIMFILRIATCYIQDFQQKLDEPIAYNLVPSDLLPLMNSSTDPGWCFERFEEIKEKRRLREVNAELEKKMKALEQQLAQAQETNAQLLKLNKIQAQEILGLTQKTQTQQEHTHAEELFAAPALIFGATPHSNNEQVIGKKRVFESMQGSSIREDERSKKFRIE